MNKWGLYRRWRFLRSSCTSPGRVVITTLLNRIQSCIRIDIFYKILIDLLFRIGGFDGNWVLISWQLLLEDSSFLSYWWMGANNWHGPAEIGKLRRRDATLRCCYVDCRCDD
jgi:hypothetical protein